MTETMSLMGGIDEYSLGRYKSDVSSAGRKVIYLDRNGYDRDTEDARKYLKEGDELTVKEIYVWRCSSTVEFMEFPGKLFNTVMFADKEG